MSPIRGCATYNYKYSALTNASLALIGCGLALLVISLIATSQATHFQRALNAKIANEVNPESYATFQELFKGIGKIQAEAATIFKVGIGITAGGIGMLGLIQALPKVSPPPDHQMDWNALNRTQKALCVTGLVLMYMAIVIVGIGLVQTLKIKEAFGVNKAKLLTQSGLWNDYLNLRWSMAGSSAAALGLFGIGFALFVKVAREMPRPKANQR